MESNPGTFLANFLLGSELVDSFSFPHFRNFFPSKNSTPERLEEIRKLHAFFNQRRADARRAVKENVRDKARKLQREAERKRRRRSTNPVYAHSLPACAEFLEKMVASQERELAELNAQLDACRDDLAQFSQDLDKVKVDKTITSASVGNKTENVQKLLKSLK